MQPEDIKNIKINFNPKQIKLFVLSIITVFILVLSVYTVDANENAVILRLGKYHVTTGPGLQFKIPLLDKVYKARVDYQYKKEFGFRTVRSDKKSQFRSRGLEHESWMLTGDLKIAEVKWVVHGGIAQYILPGLVSKLGLLFWLGLLMHRWRCTCRFGRG